MFSGVEPTDILHQGRESLLIKVADLQGDSFRVFKVLKEANPSEAIQRKLHREYDIVQSLNSSGVRKVLDKTFFRHHPALELEYIPGIPLREWLRQDELSYPNRFKIGKAIASVVSELHHLHVIHNALNPDNILINDNGEVFIIDFGMATVLTAKGGLVGENLFFDRDFPYVSPEQTGRVNRKVDHRSDLYALGVIFYELFTGRNPFHGADDSEVIHAHLTRVPSSIHQFDENLPKPLDDIILKLLSKNAEDRYDSAAGVVADFNKLDQLQGEDLQKSMSLGGFDYSGRLFPLHHLYGREEEQQILLDIFKSCVDGGKELVWVTGYSGVGKSSLIQAFREQALQQRGFFLSGKFETDRDHIPYAAVSDALTELVQQVIVALPEVSRERMLQDIRRHVGTNIKVLTDLLPALEQWMGDIPEVPPLKGHEEQFRLQLAFQNLFRAIATPRNPVVLHLDDLQWADRPSVQLLEALTDDTTLGYLMIIGSYRDQEVSANSELNVWLSRNKEHEIGIEIPLTNLEFTDVHGMLRDILHTQQSDLEDLTVQIISKTKGNPFFTYQLLLSLYEDGILYFSLDSKRWVWDVVKISQLTVTSNVADFMTRQISRLGEELQDVLNMAAVLGNRFQPTLLAAALKQPMSSLDFYLDKLSREGWLIQEAAYFRFGHDRFQQALLDALPIHQKSANHHHLAQAMLAMFSPEEKYERLFDVTRHANLGADLLGNPEERSQLFQLNLQAGNKARQSAAFLEALQYYQSCLSLLSTNPWENQFDKALQVYQALASTAFQAGERDLTDQFVAILLENARSLDHRIFAKELQMQMLLLRNSFQQAMELGFEMLVALGVDVPPEATARVARRYEKRTQQLMKRVSFDDIRELPPMKDATAEAISRIVYELSTPVYLANRKYVPFLGYLMVNQLLKYGTCTWTVYGLTQYGFMYSVEREQIDQGIAFGRLAVEMATGLGLVEIIPKTILIQNIFIAHSVVQYPETVIEMERGLQAALEMGNFEMATNLVHNMINQTYYAGVPLHELIRNSDDLDAQIKRFRFDNVVHRLQSYRQGFLQLLQYSEEPDVLHGELFSEQITSSESSTALYKINVLLNKLHLAVYYFLPERALQHAQDSKPYLEATRGALTYNWYQFHYVLVLIYLARKGRVLSAQERGEVKELRRAMKRHADLGPNSFLQKHYLVEAEYYAWKNKPKKAQEYYKRAVRSAVKHARANDEAISWEWGGRYFRETGDEVIGNLYLEMAFRAYQRWGAKGKLQQLALQFPELFGTYTTEKPSQRLLSVDLGTILKASATLASEIQLSKLLSTLMEILLENAGADTGVFLLDDDGWYIMAAGSALTGITTEQRIPLLGSSLVPETVVETVKLMSKPVIIDDAQLRNPYSSDPFFDTNRVRSVLCLPVKAQGRTLGMVYLSNAVTSGIFTVERLDLLEMLSGQIGISIENALMYQDLDRKVQERTDALRDTLEELREKNALVETRNLEITDSIAYGKTIQQAMLPDKKGLAKLLGEAFVFFKPLDVVSGDFYWWVDLEDYVLVAAVDCTGHGVPGAFMSMIGIQLLDSIVKVQGITQPDEVLVHLQDGVYEALRTEEHVLLDGMDLGLCRIHKGSNWVDYAGAKNSLCYVDSQGVHRVRGAHSSLSGDRMHFTSFDLHSLEMEPGAMLYLYSDGFQDQFGGPHDRKFKSVAFRALLGELAMLPVSEQESELVDAFRAWKGDHDQTDDVMVLGFRIP